MKLHQNLNLKVIVPSPMLAFLCKNLDYKPQSINQSFLLLEAMSVCGCAPRQFSDRSRHHLWEVHRTERRHWSTHHLCASRNSSTQRRQILTWLVTQNIESNHIQVLYILGQGTSLCMTPRVLGESCTVRYPGTSCLTHITVPSYVHVSIILYLTVCTCMYYCEFRWSVPGVGKP